LGLGDWCYGSADFDWLQICTPEVVVVEELEETVRGVGGFGSTGGFGGMLPAINPASLS
jgi:hypothetical protein